MAKWITNWPHGGKWGACPASMAAQIAAEGMFQVRLVSERQRITRFILAEPRWAPQPLLRRHRAVAVALALQPLEAYRAQASRRRKAAA